MEYNSEKNTVTIFGRTEKLDMLAKRLSGLSGEQVFGLFSNRGILIPRRMNCLALYSVLNEKLKTIHASELSNAQFQRLKYYNEFSEIQLFNLFKSIATDDDFKNYRINLFKLIIMNHVGLNLQDSEVSYLKQLKKLSVGSIDKYFSYISNMCQEQENTFDGQEINKLKDLLTNSSSSQEIIELGAKYGLTIPTNLKKSELIEYIIDVASEKNITINKEELESMTVAGLNKYCKDNEIGMSSNLTKNELVTYLFYSLSKYKILTTSINKIDYPNEFEPLDITIDYSLINGFKKDDSKRIIHYPGEEDDEFVPIYNGDEESVVEEEKEEDNSPKEYKIIVKKPESKIVEEENNNPNEEDIEDNNQSVISTHDGITEDLTETSYVVDASGEEFLSKELIEARKLFKEYKESLEYVNEYEPYEEETKKVEPIEAIKEKKVEVVKTEPKAITTNKEEINNKEEIVTLVQTTKTVSDSKMISSFKKNDAIQTVRLPKENVLPMDEVIENDLFGNEKLAKYEKNGVKKVLISVGVISLLIVIVILIFLLLK